MIQLRVGSAPAAFGFLIFFALAAAAQQLDVPVVIECDQAREQAACYATSRVTGLAPSGDGFLAVRSGPGTEYAKIDELREGDVVEIIDIQGDWRAVRYDDGRLGWAHGRWLADLAG